MKNVATHFAHVYGRIVARAAAEPEPNSCYLAALARCEACVSEQRAKQQLRPKRMSAPDAYAPVQRERSQRSERTERKEGSATKAGAKSETGGRRRGILFSKQKSMLSSSSVAFRCLTRLDELLFSVQATEVSSLFVSLVRFGAVTRSDQYLAVCQRAKIITTNYERSR